MKIVIPRKYKRDAVLRCGWLELQIRQRREEIKELKAEQRKELKIIKEHCCSDNKHSEQ